MSIIHGERKNNHGVKKTKLLSMLLLTLCCSLFSSSIYAMQQYALNCPGRGDMTVSITDYVITTLLWSEGFIVAPRPASYTDKSGDVLTVYQFRNNEMLLVNKIKNRYFFIYRDENKSQKEVECIKGPNQRIAVKWANG